MSKPQQPKFFILGTKSLLYKLICHPRIEDKSVMKKSVTSRKIAITMELHCNGKNYKSQIYPIFIDQIFFSS